MQGVAQQPLVRRQRIAGLARDDQLDVLAGHALAGHFDAHAERDQ